ncbi:fumarate hydratase [Clostridium novyi B str. ATCC 27606]|uniref:Fumarate hydratase n=2 Tax=Clostridium TaxID=1485 RepID=A0AA40ISB1_CLONO|nr:MULTISPECIES: fumarate hydratase [Clostridium]KEI12418.1 fumarate hydratase [Clostridium novyi B str. ATCC 27606]KEI15327.1 fumarate hydratase [Clostridium novyi B str. NCTC 9691]KEI18032.1 fumarate hydratase [Clostridium haemolyticum NCTC 9693]KGM99799.1 fumarate hydratase [Clostridium haemolyticum NCTC 8350]CAG7840563.1 L(+)-tartrate dehydratase subunit alpha [Clostridium haemolyticum]
MREISSEEITSAIKEIAIRSNCILSDDVISALKKRYEMEESKVGKEILSQILKNNKIAAKEEIPICQDTGVAVVFVELGQEVHVNGDINKAINEGVRQGYKEGYLRKSIVENPLYRKNTNDNTPAVIHIKLVPGNNIKLTIAPKGGGSENMSKIKMLKPLEGEEGVKKFILKVVSEAGGNPCPPIVVGVGIGGTFEKAALMSKEALLRPLNDHNEDPRIAKLEDELLNDINKLGIGPMGLGGRTTSLGVKINTHPCHIASLPVAVNINCHAARHETIIL